MKYDVGFIGVGNMGGALCIAAAKSGATIAISDFSADKCKEIASKTNCTISDNNDICKNAKYIFLGVKPQVLPELMGEISSVLAERNDDFTLVTMAAGKSIDFISGFLKKPCPIIRIMPNTPVSVGSGMILYCKNDFVKTDDDFKKLMEYAGSLDEISENLIDSGSCVSGCGPAWVYMFIEALADGGVACGLPRDKAMTYAAETLIGASKLVLESGKHPGKLKDDVCSPGGTTIAGVRALEENGFRGSVMDAVISAYKRTLELK